MSNDLQNQIDALRAELKTTDDWATGVYMAVEEILPFLLRGHPEIAKVEQLLKQNALRFEELTAHPERADDDENAGLYEAGKLLYHNLHLQGVWHGLDAAEMTRRLRAQSDAQQT